MGAQVPIGQVLVERGVVTASAVEDAAAAARSSDSRLCSKLLEARACDEGDLAAALAERHGLPGVDLSRTVVPLSATSAVPQAIVESELALPLSAEGGRLHVAVASPQDAARVVAEIRFVTGAEVSVYVAVLGSLRAAIAGCYDARAQGLTTWRGARSPLDAPPRIAAHFPTGAPAAPLDVALGDAEAATPSEEDASSQGGREGGPVAEEGRQRILVVDDDPAIRLLVQRALEHRGYAVETAGDGVEARERIRAHRPDLVLLDAMLPRLHGFELARRLRADPGTRSLPVIILSAVYRGWRFAEDARDTCGAQDYVEKPFRVDDLLRRVAAVLAGPPPVAPAAATTLLREARAARARGDLDEAVTSYEEAARVDPFSVDALRELGDVLRQQGESFRAMSALERAVDLDPGLLPALQTLAALYLETGFRAKAAEALERALRVAREPATREQLRRELLRLL